MTVYFLFGYYDSMELPTAKSVYKQFLCNIRKEQGLFIAVVVPFEREDIQRGLETGVGGTNKLYMLLNKLDLNIMMLHILSYVIICVLRYYYKI